MERSLWDDSVRLKLRGSLADELAEPPRAFEPGYLAAVGVGEQVSLQRNHSLRFCARPADFVYSGPRTCGIPLRPGALVADHRSSFPLPVQRKRGDPANKAPRQPSDCSGKTSGLMGFAVPEDRAVMLQVYPGNWGFVTSTVT